MSWEPVIFGTARADRDLPGLVEALFEQQRSSWALLREGEEALSGMRTREFTRDRARVVVQANPGRKKSTQARVDPASVARRPCFLCPASIPAEERGVAFGELVVLPNPYPILRRHCTIPARDHSPQRIEGRVGLLLDLARALGPPMLTFYNGPRCGASAPDHFHFQACDGGGVPLLADLRLDGKPARFPLSVFGRNLLVFHGEDPGTIRSHVGTALAALATLDPREDEPMINILARFQDGRYLVLLFPRARHRPRVFSAPEDSRIAISPAALEMAGLLVVAEPGHFDRVDRGTVLAIYREVSLDDRLFARLAEAAT